ncbi:carboxymuconolactone decarboxylase family protein [Amycolatopsis regifaucium]|uniref:Carboxymuconolactone decarboxylase n=1 Tax=Amycolatopsis regifaucium TaxID=546365 RepID=A0A154MWS1_9PSEU|nr:carboxymuconolactone decarboxylase family protein [Amycolatopsis regifaucium]KZB88751.1 carboxymuconolactone decarboxylase [Amycolatopsis regifaucium]OKA07179.1 carboxymuconolactone decarboxylase [Amycolatopsis regifaucium]SFI55109.1 Alkylhydroperoxidase family enzyme, contains CxxC motif [Amycolatopsis regifaucium]
MARIAPLAPPYEAHVEEALRTWMPPGVAHDPPALFRLLQHHPDLASRMRVLGAGLLAHGELPALDREIVIARVTARCGCRYEWGVHAAVFASAVGLTPEQVEATVSGGSGHPAWSGRQRALIVAVDELHDTATVSDDAWTALAEHYPAGQLLEFLVLAGWYRTIAYVANGVLLEGEPWAVPYPPDSA